MDAATAAILGALVGASATLSAGFLVPTLNGKHARKAQLFEMRRDAYLAALRTLEPLPTANTPDELQAVRDGMFPVVPQLRLLGSPDVAKMFRDIWENIGQTIEKIERGEDEDAEYEEFGQLLTTVIETIRAHLGVDDLDR